MNIPRITDRKVGTILTARCLEGITLMALAMTSSPESEVTGHWPRYFTCSRQLEK